jgi:ATP-binding cassette subfamily B protein
MPNDRTSKMEENVQHEQKPKLSHLIRLFAYGFSSTKKISCIYLGAFIVLSLLRPLLAFIWGQYIKTADDLNAGDTMIPAIFLLLSYFVIFYLIELINRYVTMGNEIEQLNLVQANRQQEILNTKMYTKLASLDPEALEIPLINDRIEQVFNFIGSRYGGLNTLVMLQCYIVIGRSISVITIALTLFIFNPWLCFILLIAPIPSIWTRTIGHNMRFKFMKDNTKLLRKASYFQNLMLSTAGKELKTLALYDFFFKKWKDAADEYTIKERELIRSQASFTILFSSIINFTILMGSIFAIILMSLGMLSLGALGAVLSLISTLVNDMKELLTGVTGFMMKKNEAAQFFDLMEMPEENNDGKAYGVINTIEIKGLKYRYPLTNHYILDGVDLSIHKGEKVAFVGENGMGKTTLIKLITGTLSPSDGELFINGIPIEFINPIRHYDGISIVVQDPARYITFTIADNIFFGDTEKPRNDNRIMTAMSFAGLDDIDKDELLGKDVGGRELSGGQWQKLAIAKAFYRERDFIILDEPTGNLDPLAENEVFKKYLALAKDKTVVFVTHRISVASLADRIIVFSDGKIVQDGSHEELIKNDGKYAHLYNEQAKWYKRK